MARVLDPVSHALVLAERCETLRSVQGFTPMCFEGREWFVREDWTGRTYALDAIDAAVATAVRRSVEARAVAERVLQRCAVVEATGFEGHIGSGAEGLDFAERAAFSVAHARGYAMDVILEAIATLDCAFDPGSALEGVVVTDCHDVVAEEVTAVLDEGVEDPYSLKAVFVLGAVGSGKSTVARQMFAGLGLRFINQDKHLMRFMDAAGEPLQNVGSRYDLLKRAQNLSRREFKQFSGSRVGLVVDMTGWDYKRVASPVQRLRALGYDVSAIVVTADRETLHRRNQARERVVPSSYIDTAYEGLWRNFPRYKRLFGPKSILMVRHNTDLTRDEWARVVGPAVRKVALDILAKPLANKAGRKWVEQQRAAKSVSAVESSRPSRAPVRAVLPVALLSAPAADKF